MDRQGPFGLQELLKFAIAQSEAETNENAFNEMDEERKLFLENALKSMSIDVMEELTVAIATLKNVKSSDTEKCDALYCIRDYIDNIDFANGFVQLGGADILKTCLQSNDVEVKSGAVNVIAEMSQNNPFCQKYFLEKNFLGLLLEQVDKNDELAANLLYAVSGMAKNFESGIAELIKLGGFEIILNCLDTPHSRVFIKATFLISTLCLEYSLVKDRFVLLGAFEKLLQHLEVVTDFDIKTEAVLRALAELALSTQFQIDEQKKLTLVENLKNIVNKNQNLPQCEEIVSYANKLLEIVTS